MLIKTLPVGMLATNCYIVIDEDTMKCVIVDPGAESNTILDYIEAGKLNAEAILLTHGHFDHHTALENVLESLNIPVFVSEKEVNRSDKYIQLKVPYDTNMKFCVDGDIISVGGLYFRVMETPGHSPGSVTFVCTQVCDDETGDKAGAVTGSETVGALFTGDTLFCGDCGRTDLEGGNREHIIKSLQRIAALEGNYEIYPGHDETTTLDNERLTNLDMKIAMGDIT